MSIIIHHSSINDNILFVWSLCLLTVSWWMVNAVYDVTRRETFTNLVDVWGKEIELYSTNQECVRMLVGNKVDRVSLQSKLHFFFFFFSIIHIVCVDEHIWLQESERGVSREEGIALAKELKCMFLECSARTRQNVEHCFEELALKVRILIRENITDPIRGIGLYSM